MDEFKKIADELLKVEEMYGMLGVFGAIMLLIIGISTFIYHKAYLVKYANSIFERSLTKYKKELNEELGVSLISKVQSVQTDIETLKNRLNLTSGQEGNWLNEKRQSMSDLYSAQVDLSSSIMATSSYSINTENFSQKNQMVANLDESYHRFNIAHAKFEIYCQDPKLLEFLREITIKTGHLRIKKVDQLFRTSVRYSLLKTIQDNMDQKMDPNDPKRLEMFKEVMKDINEFVKTSEEEMITDYSEIVEIEKKVVDRISTLIKASFKGE